jgi:hypothetical protein
VRIHREPLHLILRSKLFFDEIYTQSQLAQTPRARS